MKNIIVGKLNRVQVVTVEDEEGFHNIICKLQDVPCMVEEIAELRSYIEKINNAYIFTHGHGVGKILNSEDGKSLYKLIAKLNQSEIK